MQVGKRCLLLVLRVLFGDILEVFHSFSKRILSPYDHPFAVTDAQSNVDRGDDERTERARRADRPVQAQGGALRADAAGARQPVQAGRYGAHAAQQAPRAGSHGQGGGAGEARRPAGESWAIHVDVDVYVNVDSFGEAKCMWNA